MIQDTQYTNRPLAWIYTLAFHGLVILVLFFVVLNTPIPPYPLVGGGSGLEVNFGTSDQGMGNVQPEEYIPVETKNLNETEKTDKINDNKVSQGEKILTQETEEAPAVKTSAHQDIKKQQQEVIKINDPVVNPKALYKKTNKKGGSEGETGKPGDQGNPQGSLYAKNHYGTPGSGDGTGNGDGVGTGTGNGTGPSFDLSGRASKFLPKPDYAAREVGTVVVKIWVSKDGSVSRAEAGARGTTTSSQTLFRLAQAAAMRARFSANPNAPEEQKGTITYHFVFQN
jgi:periplasmic protein TonB